MHEANYEITVRGPMSEAALHQVIATHATLEIRTILTGQVRDQSELQALLFRLHGMGIELIGVHRTPDATPWDAGSPVVGAGLLADSRESR